MAWLLIRPDARSVWRNEEVGRRLSWYYAVMSNQKPAKFLICKKITVGIELDDLSEEELWGEHEKLSKVFKGLYENILAGKLKLEDLENPERSFLDLKIELVKRMLTHCNFCERRCGVNRVKRERGFCRLDASTRVASWFHHWGEEAPLVPSGTIFFSSCSFRCQHCQNYDISFNPKSGFEVDAKELAAMAKTLRREGCRNINYVGGNPDQSLHTIVESLKYLNINTPLLWNNNAYSSLEAMKILSDIIDIWLPDLKYGNDSCAERLSKVPKYFQVATRNIKTSHENGDLIIRHLVLPNQHVKECCTPPALKWIADNCPRALVNVMEQYRPEHIVLRHPELYPDIARRLTRDEIEKAYSIARELGLCFEPVS